jgi:hypothetical protein
LQGEGQIFNTFIEVILYRSPAGMRTYQMGWMYPTRFW